MMFAVKYEVIIVKKRELKLKKLYIPKIEEI
jgi:hypothetical protein